LQSLRQTAATERDLAAMIAGLTARMSAAEAVALALEQLSGGMQDVAERLGEKQTDDPVQRKLKEIEDQFERLLGILGNAANQSEERSAEQPSDQPDQQEQSQPAGPPGDVITLIAQLEIVKGLQEDCLRRTAELQESRADRPELSETELRELTGLQQIQQRLTDLMQNLLTRLMQDQNTAPAGSAPNDAAPNAGQEPSESSPGTKP
jgi:hypothetical protein